MPGQPLAVSQSGSTVISALLGVPHTCHTIVRRVARLAEFGSRPSRHGISWMMLPGASRVQVDESGVAGRVTHTFHQLTRIGACFRDKLVTGMTQIMQMNAEAGFGECTTPDATAEVSVPQ
jgi:hypothetical protein